MFEGLCALVLLGIAAALFEWIFSGAFGGSGESSSYDTSSTTEETVEDEDEEEDDDTLLTLMLAHDVYELEKKRSHAVCSRCRNARWSSDEDDNEYYECPYIGYLRPWEADWERYCEHYDP